MKLRVMEYIRLNKCMAIVAVMLLVCSCAVRGESAGLSSYVNPLVGTYGEGNTYPGPTAPFGMVQLSPDTENGQWSICSGYDYSDPTIKGFSMTHLSGTGCPDYGDFLFVPQVGKPRLEAGDKKKPEEGYQSAYSHDDQVVKAGYYKVKLQKSGVVTELAATEHAGIMRFTFPESDEASILTDLTHLIHRPEEKYWSVVHSSLRVEDDNTVTGYHLVNNWAQGRQIYFAARYSKAFGEAKILKNDGHVYYSKWSYRFLSSKEATAKDLKFLAKFKTVPDEVIMVKVGISTVSAANALENLDKEIPSWNFEKVVSDTQKKWDAELGKFEIEGTQKEKETFYTSVYHAFLTPNIHEDVNGEYRGFDRNVHASDGFTKYTVFSTWDTYRATHPLFALVQAERNSDMVNSMLAHYDQSPDKLLPIWELQGYETWCMIGYHSVPIIADAYLKGNKGFDAERAFEACKTTAMNPEYDSVLDYAERGWVAHDLENESVSKTLEYAFDDYTIAMMAKAMGKSEDYKYFIKRAGHYKNVFDKQTGFMRPRAADGTWKEPFDPLFFKQCAGDYTEATSWQYTWYVPHDVEGLMYLMGGKEAFIKKLDEFFTMKGTRHKAGLGEYWHGNEPSHHIIYLYCYAGQPWKAQKYLSQVVKSQYGNEPHSLVGNDDCGQMSAWYIFTCMGFYPVAPASDFYAIGAPQMKRLDMKLSNGRHVVVTAENLSDENVYVQSLKVNGKKWVSPFLPYSEIRNGAKLEFVMGSEPNIKWGVN